MSDDDRWRLLNFSLYIREIAEKEERDREKELRERRDGSGGVD